MLDLRPLRFDLFAKLFRPALLDQDLDARLVDIVAPAEAVVDAQDRLEVGEQVPPRQELADHGADHRGSAEPAADEHLEAHLAIFADRVQADVVHRHGAAVVACAVQRDLELARQE